MSETLSFPGLGLELEINRTAFRVFGISIYWYGIFIALAFLLGAMYVMRRVPRFGLDADRVMDVILGGVILGIVGARLYYAVFSWDTYRDDPMRIFNIREGGIAIYGAIIGAVIAALLICRWRKVKFLPCVDLATGGLLLGQAIGRWGNFVNMEAFGSNTTLPWGMTSPTIQWYLQSHASSLEAIGVAVDPNMPVHPTFFYESVWCLLGFAFIAWYTTRRRFDGELALIYLGWYGLGRFFIEGLRTDPLLIGSIRVSQMVALLCVIAAALALVLIHSRIRRESDPDYMPLYVNTEEGKAVLAGTFYPAKNENKEKPGDVHSHKEATEAADSGEADSGETDTDEATQAAADAEAAVPADQSSHFEKDSADSEQTEQAGEPAPDNNEEDNHEQAD